MTTLSIISPGPGLSIQDLGRPGWRAQGLPNGGAADPLALIEGAALLGTPLQHASIEMMGFGAKFRISEGVRFALTGARMTASIDGVPVRHKTGAFLPAGATLTIGPAEAGVYGYLNIAGGIDSLVTMGSRAAHLTAGIGGLLKHGDMLRLGKDPDRAFGPQKLDPPDRLHGGPIRVMPGPQTAFFPKEKRAAFAATVFTRNPRGNRQGIRLDHDGADLAVAGGLAQVSDLIVPGDIQITGTGVPYVLLSECQTIGGYPRIGNVVPADLPKIAQASAGTRMQFTFLTVAEADATYVSHTQMKRQLTQMCTPAVRDPNDIADLLRYQLISGATRGDDLDPPS